MELHKVTHRAYACEASGTLACPHFAIVRVVDASGAAHLCHSHAVDRVNLIHQHALTTLTNYARVEALAPGVSK